MREEKISQLVQYFCKNDFKSIEQVILSYPETESTRNAVSLLQSDFPFYTIVALDSIGGNNYFMRNYETALIFSSAAYYCVQSYLSATFTDRKDEMLYYAGSSSYYILRCLLDTGDSLSGVQTFAAIAAYYNQEINKPEFLAARLTAVDLYLANENPESARQLFVQIEPSVVQSYNRPYFDRLAEKLRRLFAEISTLPSESIERKAAQLKTDLEGIIASIQDSIQQTKGKPSEKEISSFEELQDLLRRLQECTDENLLTDLCSAINQKISSWYTGKGRVDENDVITKRNQVQQLGNLVFQSSDEGVLKEALLQLKTLLTFFESRFPEDENYVLWLIASCQDWLNENQEAVNALERLRSNLELKQSYIRNRIERGGVFDQFPLLFNLLIRNYYFLKDPRHVLRAIEASKGQMLAAIPVDEPGKAGASYTNFNEQLSELLAKEKVHFLSFFVDENYSLSVLATSNGKCYAKGIELTREVINNWATKNYHSPAVWQNPSTGIFAKNVKVDMGAELEKLLPVLSLAIEEGNLAEGDHIVYASHENLMLFPLHYARFKGQYLISRFSLSRIHNAFQLINLLKDEPDPSAKVTCLIAPSRQDQENPEKMEAFHEVANWLQENANRPVVIPKAEITELKGLSEQSSLIHFAAHGVFPTAAFEDQRKNNPFYNSGILLNYEGNRPELDLHFDYYKMKNLLNPETLLSMGNIFKGSHVSFQACVSGRMKEGIAGDALGMEWAAFFCGARSSLTAAWDIDIFWTNKFFLSFYDLWLNKGMSKADAYTQTMRNLMENKFPGDKPNVYFWGGMILSGNWKK